MHHKRTLILIASLFLLDTLAASARADELAVKGRAVFAKYQRAVVTVETVLKVSSQAGRSNESKRELTGTVLDPSGLTVLALSACDPTEMYRRMSENPKIDIEVSDIKLLLDDGTELPSEIVLRDRDLDLAFIRPKTKPATPLTAVDLSQSGSAQVLDEVIALNRLNKAASRAYSASFDRISGVVQKPRTFYTPDSSQSAASLGSPAFLLNGNILGVFVMRAVSSGSSERPNAIAIILPAEDILKAAKQAPEVKPESEKKEEPKAPAQEAPQANKDGAEKK